MVRVGGMRYTCNPKAAMGQRITDMRIGDKPVEADKTYKVAGWAAVGEDVTGEPIWDVVAGWLRAHQTVAPRVLNTPRLLGVEGNPGIA
jgi:sulfur-oxidizing protein SoxB